MALGLTTLASATGLLATNSKSEMAFDQFPNGLTDQEVYRTVRRTSERLVDLGNGVRPPMLEAWCLAYVLLIAVRKNRINVTELGSRIVISDGDRQRVREALRKLGFGFSESSLDLTLS